jgi:hypothetical protein
MLAGATARTVDFTIGGKEHTASPNAVVFADLIDADARMLPRYHPNTKATAGLYFVNSISQHVVHHSLFERSTLIALDYDDVQAVTAQPLRLTWTDAVGKLRRHIPDFAAVIDGEPTVINCRPATRMTDLQLQQTAALANAFASRGWQVRLVVDYQAHALAAVRSLLAARHAIDPGGYLGQFQQAVSAGPVSFGDLVEATPAPGLARSFLRRALFDRHVRADVSTGLGDPTLIHPVDGARS